MPPPKTTERLWRISPQSPTRPRSAAKNCRTWLPPRPVKDHPTTGWPLDGASCDTVPDLYIFLLFCQYPLTEIPNTVQRWFSTTPLHTFGKITLLSYTLPDLNEPRPMIQKFLDTLLGSYNEKQLARLQRHIPSIIAKDEEYKTLSDDDLKAQFAQWRETLTQDPTKADSLMVEVFAGVRNAARRLVGHEYEVKEKTVTWEMVHFEVQLLGGMVLHEGRIAEMKTGEGKTLVCTLPVILNALTGRGVHVITVNDYLATRDGAWMEPLYAFCGLSVGVVTNEKTPAERKEAYQADITYGTNNEFGFDYLRDNMAQKLENIVQRDLVYAIVDEVDSILIDEARTPLIISAPAEESTSKYAQYAQLVKGLKEDEDYTIDLKAKQATLTEEGIAKMEGWLGIGNIFTEQGFDEVQHIEQALKARVIMHKDQDYVVRDEKVVIIDEFTGRMMAGRRYSDGLHQALEAKEGVPIQRESKTLATITFQNYFRLYDKLAGMTGTAETEAEEFAKIYKLDTIVMPTNKPLQRADLGDRIFKNERGKFTVLAEEVASLHQNGQPVLIGTVNIDTSEKLSAMLTQKGIPHEVLNAKHHEREAEIVAKAGQKGAVTIATNMAGRGTDIKLGEGVRELGGLAILGTERHESRRIDNQLRGRAGRQGDPGFSQFYVAMTDELMRRFGGERLARMMESLGLEDTEVIENKMISRSVENAQKKIEGLHFDARKHIVQYDDVMNIHREKMYARRRTYLMSENISDDIEQMFRDAVTTLVEQNAPTPEHSSAWNTQDIFDGMTRFPVQGEETLTLEELNAFQYRDEMIESLQNYLLGAWDTKCESVPPEKVETIARQIVLRSIDELWLEHINEMTQLRDRVALSGYAQKDPVVEYRREGFLLFSRLLQNIRMTAVLNLLRIDFAPSLTFEAADYSKARTNQEEIEATLTDTGEYTPNAPTPSHTTTPEGITMIRAEKETTTTQPPGQKYAHVGRNEPCPCGSGKKFKHCHGRQG